MGRNKIIFLNTGILYIRVILSLLISLAATRYILEALGEIDFGIYNLIAGVVTLLSFMSTSMSTSTQRFISYERGHSRSIASINNVFVCSLGMHIWISAFLLFIIMVGGSLLIKYVLNIPAVKIYDAYIVLGSVGISMVLTTLSVPYEAVLMARENMLFYAISQLVGSLLRLLIAIILIHVDNNQLILFSILTALIPFIILIWEIFYCNKQYEETNIRNFSLNLKKNIYLKSMASFLSYTLLGTVGWAIRAQGYTIILNYFWGVVINAANGIATQVSHAFITFSSSLTISLRPQLIQSVASNEFKRMNELVMWSSKFPLIFVCIFIIPVFVMLPYILNIWLTVVPEYTVVFCRILLISLLFNQSTLGFNMLLEAEGTIKKVNIFTSISLILCTVLAFVLGKLGQSPFFVYSLIVLNDFFIGIIRILLACKTQVVKLYSIMKMYLKIIICFIVTYGFVYIGWLNVTKNILNALTISIASAILFLGLVYFISLTKTEKDLMMNAFKKFIRKRTNIYIL